MKPDEKIQLTDQERQVLAIIAGAPPQPATGPWIFSSMNSFGFGITSVRGAHKTAASLCRKRLAERTGTTRQMSYGITPLGREVLRRGLVNEQQALRRAKAITYELATITAYVEKISAERKELVRQLVDVHRRSERQIAAELGISQPAVHKILEVKHVAVD